MQMSHLGSGIALLRFRDTETIPKQLLQTTKIMHRRQALIYGMIEGMVEFA